MRLGTIAAAVLLMVSACLAPGAQRVTSVEGITEYRLDNGLRVLLFPDPSKQTVTVNVTYLVGSRHENYGETGMAHLLEHLLFLGSPKHPKMDTEFTQHGARSNGSTSFDRTNYHETFSATEENLRWALDLESDRMVNAFVSKQSLDSEMTVVRNEFERGENDPNRVLLQRAMATAFQWHNYGKTTIGAKADLEHVPIDRLQAFYRRYYQPDNAVLTVAGKIEEPKALALVEEYFGKIAKPSRQLQPTYTLDPDQDGERTVTVRRVGDVQSVLALYRTPDGAHPDAAALDLLTTILLDTPAGRLHKALVETKKAAGVGGGMWQLKEPGVMMYQAQVRKEANLEDARNTMLKVIHNVIQEPPTAEEVDRAKKAELAQFERAVTDSDRLGLLLSEPIARGDWRLLFLHRDNLRKVTAEDVLRVARAYLKEDNRTLAYFIPIDKPDRAAIPPPTDVASAVKDYKGDAAVAQGEAFDPSPENIEKRLVRTKMSNGMKMALLPKKTRGSVVTGTITLHFGDVDSLRGLDRVQVLTAQMLMRGTQKHTRQQIQEELDKLKTRMSVIPGASATRVMMETTRPNLTAALKLAAEILREPSFPEQEWEQLKQSSLASIEQQRSDPAALASTVLQQHLNPYPKGDIRYVMMPDEQIEATKTVTLGAVKDYYRNFYGASAGELVLIGDLEPAEMQKLGDELFGSWKSGKPHARVSHEYTKVAAVNKVLETPDKANALIVAGMPLKILDTSPDFPALVLGNYMLGGSTSSRLWNRIRTKEGYSYGVNSYLIARSVGDGGAFQFSAIAAPQNVPKVQAAFQEEVARALKDGFSPDEVEQAKKGWLQRQTVNRGQDGSLAALLAGNEYESRTMDFYAGLEKKIGTLSPQQIVETLGRYVDPAQLSFVKAGDFKKAGVTP